MTIELKTNALITLDEYFALTGQDKSNKNIDQDQANFYINVASQDIENYCGRKFIKPETAVVESFDGDGTSEYFVKHLRIATNTTPTLEYRVNDTWYSNDITLYPISHDDDSGEIWFTVRNRTFASGKANWRVTYYYGWTQPNIPDDLKMVCAQLAFRNLQLLAEKKEGLATESFGDSSTTYNFAGMPDNIKQVLDHYRRKLHG